MKKTAKKALLTCGVVGVGALSIAGCFGDKEPVPADNTAEVIATLPLSTEEVADTDTTVSEAIESTTQQTVEAPENLASLDEDGSYTTAEDVCSYLIEYGTLPHNFITKKEANKLGWSGGSLEPYAPGCCIGGDRFGNYEGVLPKEKGRTYTECDIDTLGAKSRGAKRIVFSNDGNIYYTEDHYETFTLLYGDDR